MIEWFNYRNQKEQFGYKKFHVLLSQRNNMNSRKKLLATFLFILLSSLFSFSQQVNDTISLKEMTLLKPSYLKAGDSIAIVAPAGILNGKREAINQAKVLAESWGLKVMMGDYVFEDNNHFAGTDQERTKDFQRALDNPNIKAIWCARGGYGSVRIIDKLDFSKFKENPKWIIGYSDVTAFHNHIHNLGIETLHAMMGSSMIFDPNETAESKETLRKALFGETLNYEFTSSDFSIIGEAEGELVGGNLTILLTMLGSDSQLNTEGKILFIEEIGEYKYHIDRMLQSLKRAGYFDKLKGIIVGDMTNIKKNTTVWGTSIERLILDATAEYDFPILFGFPAGHEPDNRAMIMGRKVKMSVTETLSKVTF